MREKIPFGNNIPGVGITGHNFSYQTGPLMRDVYVDMAGNICKRPALIQFADTGQTAAVNGLYWWDDREAVIATSNGKIFYALRDSTTFTEPNAGIYGLSDLKAEDYKKVSWAKWSDTELYFANGGQICNIHYGSPWTTTDMEITDAPAATTAITYMDKYLFSQLDTTGQVWHSGVGVANTNWGEYFEAESNSDRLNWIEARNGELYLFGKESTEVWYNDGKTPFSRLSQGLIDLGSYSIRGPVWADAISNFVWMDHKKRIVKMSGRTGETLSPTLDQYLQYMVADDIREKSSGHYFMWEGIPFYLFTSFTHPWGPEVSQVAGLPEEGMTIAVNLYTGDWYEWSNYYRVTSGGLVYELDLPLQGSSFLQTPYGVYVGDASDGLIHKLTRGGDDECRYGVAKPQIRSAPVDRGDAGAWKVCNGLIFTIKAPQTHTGHEFIFTVDYSDDGGTSYSTERPIVVNVSSGTKEYVIKSLIWGRYQTRIWRLTFTDTKDFAIGAVIEDFDYVL